VAAPDLPHGAFDAAVCTQVYEYVADMPAALAHARRLLTPGGRLLVLDTDWDSIVWRTGDEARMTRVLAAWDEHLVHRDLPRRLPQLLAEAEAAERAGTETRAAAEREREGGEDRRADEVHEQVRPRALVENAELREAEAGEHEQGAGELKELEHRSLRCAPSSGRVRCTPRPGPARTGRRRHG
jgi:SAM-dependent methyltransferase